MPTATRLEQLAERNDGVVSARQAREAGVSSSSFQRWASARSVERLAPGVHLVAPASGRLDRGRQLLRAALLANTPTVGLAGRSAWWAHGLGRLPWPLCVGIPADARATPVPGVRIVRCNRKLGFGVVPAGEWPALSVVRTLLDLAREVDDLAHLALACDALRHGRLDVTVAASLLASHPGMHGSARTSRTLARLAGTRPDAASEVLVREGLARAGVPTEPRPRWVDTPLGRFQVDVPLAGVPVGVECDSVTHHGDQASLERDHRKTNGLRLVGYDLVRVSHRQAVTGLDELVGVVRHLAELADPRVAG